MDDDPGQRTDCRELLEEAGFEVADAGDGRKALRRLSDEEQALPDLIVLDLSMPFMDGWDFIATLRDHKPLAAIPVVLVSAYDADPDIQGAVAAYLKKPIEPRDLVAAVKGALSPNR